MKHACLVCTNGTGDGTESKIDWYERSRRNGVVFGFVSFAEGKPVALVEVIPLLNSPYPISKDQSTTFITCVYSSPDSRYDYRGELIESVLEECRKLGFSRVEVLSGEVSPFPNGPTSFFVENGFRNLGTVAHLLLCSPE
ncbi:hypothetical protein [Mesotoga sp. B105.6.4]|uniref:hypothetical protein n=1 Tax=Mesotoga sp. B105.6.4 TaxID=1582224 RepID=UPI0015E111A2|nr:hypothetical protein [Mesotoga sp. B105.6.4]